MGGKRYAPAALPPGKRRGTHCIGGCVGPRTGVEGAENLAPTGIRSPNPRRESLYRLNYPGPHKSYINSVNTEHRVQSALYYYTEQLCRVLYIPPHVPILSHLNLIPPCFLKIRLKHHRKSCCTTKHTFCQCVLLLSSICTNDQQNWVQSLTTNFTLIGL